MPEGRPAKAFFSYAGEDRAVVDAVYSAMASAYPDIAPWMAPYEIVGGQDLIDRIAAGMDQAERFLIFLSAASIDKPWVRAELKRAIMREIEGVEPDFIVPVKLGHITSVPPFLESKKYIDLERLTRGEWLAEIHAAIVGTPVGPSGEPQPNLRATMSKASDEPRAIGVLFETVYWAAPIGFRIETRPPIESGQFAFPGRTGMSQLAVAERRDEHFYGVRIGNERLLPGHPFLMFVQFAQEWLPEEAIADVGEWDGRGGTSDIRFISFGTEP